MKTQGIPKQPFKLKEDQIEAIISECQRSGGCTFSLKAGVITKDLFPGNAYAVSPFKERERKINTHIGLSTFEQMIHEFVSNNLRLLQQDDKYLGVWFEERFWYFDVVVITENKADAFVIAEACNQEAIYDFKKKTSIPLIPAPSAKSDEDGGVK